MSKVGTTKKEIFTALGSVRIFDNVKRFVPDSSAYVRDKFSRMEVGKKISCTFFDKVPTRSQSQLAYHMILMGYLAEHTGQGNTKEEMHDAVMRLKFGTKRIVLKGLNVDVRKSVSDDARFPKWDMMALIEYDLELCTWAGIHVPTMEELGYIKN